MRHFTPLRGLIPGMLVVLVAALSLTSASRSDALLTPTGRELAVTAAEIVRDQFVDAVVAARTADELTARAGQGAYDSLTPSETIAP